MPEMRRNFIDKNEINNESLPYNRKFLDKISQFLPEYLYYDNNGVEESRKRFDWTITNQYNNKYIKIEIECGITEDDWKHAFPKPYRWPRALSIVGRKVTEKNGDYIEDNWDYFIKFNMKLTSAYVVRKTTLTRLFQENKLVYKEVENKYGVIKDNKKLWSIPWDEIHNDGIIIIENDKWENFCAEIRNALGVTNADNIEIRRRKVEKIQRNNSSFQEQKSCID